MGSASPLRTNLGSEDAVINRPACPNCSVKMWLIKIEHFVGLPEESQRQHFECKACGATAILPPL